MCGEGNMVDFKRLNDQGSLRNLKFALKRDVIDHLKSPLNPTNHE